MDSASAELLRFVQERLPALCEAFAQTPLMRVSVTTDEGSVTLEKAEGLALRSDGEIVETRRIVRSHDYLPDAEPGRSFTTVAADVVGIFHSAPELPDVNAEVGPDTVLGFIEALKLRTPVRAGIAGRLVGQVAEDGQPVDFGETLFVVDGGLAAIEPAGSSAPEPEPEAPLEPPRI
jgi:biotin carboxyl carrier protein